MSAFSERRPCPKCGGHFVATRYDAGTDRIARQCSRCRYQWHEAPLDRAQSAFSRSIVEVSQSTEAVSKE